MTAFDGTNPGDQMPNEWLATGIVRYIDDPYSDEALAEKEKAYIDLGPVDMDACLGADTTGALIKRPVHDELYFEKFYGNNKAPSGVIEASKLFANAARLILGEERYLKSGIDLTYRRDLVKPGTRQVGLRPHDDNYHNNDSPTGHRKLRLIGLLCNVMPTILMQGGFKTDNLDADGGISSVRRLNKRFHREPIPAGRLVLIPPAMLHDSGRAPADTEGPIERVFMRWWLSF